jgi:small subunit ribosomal protein S2
LIPIKKKIAVQEAKRLNIPVFAIVDTNSDPDDIIYPIPGNDDALRSIQLYCNLVSSAVVEGIQAEMRSQGIDLGESVDVPLLEEVSSDKANSVSPVAEEA